MRVPIGQCVSRTFTTEVEPSDSGRSSIKRLRVSTASEPPDASTEPATTRKPLPRAPRCGSRSGVWGISVSVGVDQTGLRGAWYWLPLAGSHSGTLVTARFSGTLWPFPLARFSGTLVPFTVPVFRAGILFFVGEEIARLPLHKVAGGQLLHVSQLSQSPVWGVALAFDAKAVALGHDGEAVVFPLAEPAGYLIPMRADLFGSLPLGEINSSIVMKITIVAS
jgi:hypothetical protein